MCETALLFIRVSRLQCCNLLHYFEAAIILFTAIAPVSTSDDEIFLVQRLLSDQPYSNLMRPGRNRSDPVVVKFAVDLVQIIDVDERNQEMKTNVWLQMNWQDHQLIWDPTDYGDIQSIRLLPHRVWRPDIVLLNNADSKYEVSYLSNVVVTNDTWVNWVPPAIYRSSCTINVEYFPFDEQVCEMKFGSWTYDRQELQFEWKYSCVMLVGGYMESGVWYVMDARGQIVADSHNPPREYVSYKITLRRRVLFYTINLVIPVALISLNTFTIFYIPACEGEKVTLGICITVSLAVFFTLLSKLLPSTSLSVPLMSKYLLFTFILNVAAIFVTIVIINWNYRTPRTHRMPNWARTIFLHLLPRLLRMTPPDHVVEERIREQVSRHISATRQPMHTPSASPASIRLVGSPPSSSMRPRQLYSAPGSSDEDESIAQTSLADESDRDSCVSDSRVRRAASDTLHRQRRHILSKSRALSEQPSESFASRSAAALEDQDEAAQVAAIRSSALMQVKNQFLKSRVRDTVDAVNFMTLHLDNENDYNKVLDEWKFAAAVIDRAQLIAFLFITITGTIWFMMQTPHLFENVSQSEIIQRLKNESQYQCGG